MIKRAALATMLIAVTGVAPVGAQLRQSASERPTLADSVARLDALRKTPAQRIATLDEAVERAELSFALVPEAYSGRIPTLTPTRLLADARDAVRRAETMSRDDPRVLLGRAQVLLHSTTAVTRHASRAAFRDALDRATVRHDTTVMVAAHLALGYAHWRSHDALADRRIEVDPGSAIRSIKAAMQPVLGTEGVPPPPQKTFEDVRQSFENSTQALPRNVTGDSDYRSAEVHFRDAAALDPGSCLAFRGLAMVLVTRDRWTDLRQSAQRARAACDSSPWADLALGLAAARLGAAEDAFRAFDAALDGLSPSERAWLDDIGRVLPPTDTARLVSAQPAARQDFERLYWMMADPVWSTSENESRLEFLSRLAYAELRWSLPERGLRGADSDRGRIFVRYGPPEIVAVFAPSTPSSAISGSIYLGETTCVWVYSSGLLFAFSLSPSFGTARGAFDDDFMVRRFADAQPVRWDNVSGPAVDSLPVDVLRFRAGTDSLALLIAAPAQLSAAPPSALLTGQLWMVSQDARIIGHDSLIAPAGGTLQWTAVTAGAPLVIRVEAVGPDAERVARSVRVIEPVGAGTDRPLPLRGPALSDLVVAHVEARRGATSARWSDQPPRVLTGGVRTGGAIRLMWESYELSARDGTHHIETTIELRRERATVSRIAATVLGALADIVRRSESADQLTLQFTQERTAAAALLTDIDLALGETAPGTYRVTVTVRDLHTDTRWTRTQRLQVLPPE
jgi:GWxTD domain-containing protein